MSKVKDLYIDKLLCFMNDYIEEKGGTLGTVRFDFNIDKGEDYFAFKEKTKLSSDEIQKTLNTSYSRGYIGRPYIGPVPIYSLTTEGQGRAISCEAAKNYTEKPQQSNITIGAIHGPTQIGDNNTQNIEGVFEYILTKIEKSEAPEKEKEKAKGLLQKALEHPITCSIVGAGTSALIAKLSGGNS